MLSGVIAPEVTRYSIENSEEPTEYSIIILCQPIFIAFYVHFEDTSFQRWAFLQEGVRFGGNDQEGIGRQTRLNHLISVPLSGRKPLKRLKWIGLAMPTGLKPRC